MSSLRRLIPSLFDIAAASIACYHCACISDSVQFLELTNPFLFYYRPYISTGGNAIASVHLSIRLSVCFYSNFWTEWPLTLTFCFHSSSGVESRRSRPNFRILSQRSKCSCAKLLLHSIITRVIQRYRGLGLVSQFEKLQVCDIMCLIL